VKKTLLSFPAAVVILGLLLAFAVAAEKQEAAKRPEGKPDATEVDPTKTPERDPNEQRDRDRHELQRRMRHMVVAAENLRAAGLNKQADELMRQADDMARRFHDGDRPHDLHAEIAELRDQVRQLRRDFEELRYIVRMMIERDRARNEKKKDPET